MKTATFGTLSILASLAAAVPMDKRDEVVVTDTAVTTWTDVVATSTVWVDPSAGAPSADPSVNHAPPFHVGTAPTSAAAAAPSVPNSYTQVPPVSSAPAPSSSTQVPPMSSAPAPVEPPTTQASQAAPTSQATAAAAAPSSQAGGGVSGLSGQQQNGFMTVYDVETGNNLACGQLGNPNAPVVALTAVMFDPLTPYNAQGLPNPNNNPFCGKGVTINYGGKPTSATIGDRCPGCDPHGLDLPTGFFQDVTGVSYANVSFTWSFD